MKFNHLFKFLLILSVLFIGCEENFPYEDVLDLSGASSENSSSQETSYSLSVSQFDVYLYENESLMKKIEVISNNVNWIITGIPEWLTVTPAEGGNGKTEVEITAMALPAGEKRTAQLKLQSNTAEYSWSEYFTVYQCVSIEGHEYVDLGLPSGIKWATCNIGATKPEETGDLYAWGEINTKDSYSSSNSLTYDNSSYNINISGDMRYDAACYCWKGPWRMPTKNEFIELVENCAWEWTAVNGVNGYKVTSTTNGNSIFLSSGSYWSGTYYSTTYSSAARYSYCFHVTLSNYVSDDEYRYYGYRIRPVCELKVEGK